MTTKTNLVNGILKHDSLALARAITLIESNLQSDRKKAAELIKKIQPYSGNSMRIAVSGIPGSGKSTLIESLGLYAIEQGHKVAVLAIDPSSSVSGGSILGDKTRMELLSKSSMAFVRPTPSSGFLGGVGSNPREAILLCEAAGFDVLFIETMGVGQGEIEVHSMVDVFLLLYIVGLGDELQNIKKGILEVTDAVIINKADGSNKEKALQLKKELELVVPYLNPFNENRKLQILTVSAVKKEGIEDIWQLITQYIIHSKKTGYFKQNRTEQNLHWMRNLVQFYLNEAISDNRKINDMIVDLEKMVLNNEILATEAADSIKKWIRERLNTE